MIRLERNADFINKIANSDAVRPFIRPDGAPMDWAAAVAHRPSVSGIVVLSNGEDAVGAFSVTAINLEQRQQVFKAHLLFAESCRGARALATWREMQDWLFARGTTLLWASVNKANVAAIRFAEKLGWAPTFSDQTHQVFEMRAA